MERAAQEDRDGLFQTQQRAARASYFRLHVFLGGQHRWHREVCHPGLFLTFLNYEELGYFLFLSDRHPLSMMEFKSPVHFGPSQASTFCQAPIRVKEAHKAAPQSETSLYSGWFPRLAFLSSARHLLLKPGQLSSCSYSRRTWFPVLLPLFLC